MGLAAVVLAWLWRSLVVGLADDVLVLVRLKWRPPSGRPRWRG